MLIRNATIIAAVLGLGCRTARPPQLDQWRHELPLEAPNLLPPSRIYETQGHLVGGLGVPFVASVRTLGGASPGSTQVVLSLSLANRDLQFERSSGVYEAVYVVQASFRGAKGEYQVSGSEIARVRTRGDTRRTRESILFRRDTWLPPGQYLVTVRLRDVNQRELAISQDSVVVPRFEAGVLAPPMPVYRAGTRTDAEAPLSAVVNPRGWYRFGFDSVLVYLEAIGLERSTPVTIDALDGAQQVVWSDSARFKGGARVEGMMIAVPEAVVAPGQLTLSARLGESDPVRTPLFVTLTDRWAVPNLATLDTMLSFFGEPADTFRAAAADERAARWRDFWVETDETRTTNQHEILDRFFEVLDRSNREFAEPGVPGWLTDRGQVVMTIGQPDWYVDGGAIAVAVGSGSILWEYEQLGIRLTFTRGRGIFRWTFTERSRVDYRKAVLRYRQLYGDQPAWRMERALGK